MIDNTAESRCGLVSPFWVQLGWVQWAAHPEREKLMNIEYRRCTKAVDSAPYCAAHAKEMGK